MDTMPTKCRKLELDLNLAPTKKPRVGFAASVDTELKAAVSDRSDDIDRKAEHSLTGLMT